MEKATFAAGCFWGVESTFRKLTGVLSTRVGYTGGHIENPTYEQVCSHKTGHAEAVEVTYDPTIISYEELLTVFWSCHNPTLVDQQGPDIGDQYRSAIFYYNKEQCELANQSKNALEKKQVYGKPIATQIVPATAFYQAEEYHQCYLQKHNRE